ncbi:23S rRNA (uridine(2552)-2'-O)-methyltransferase [archaeon]|nr:23S rRNA (uridine(2552)-2'-O)-methyltransferase [archaeon]
MKDKLAFKARKEGYRARSAYKLIQINKKHDIIKENDKVLDIGCAPGSWMQVVLNLNASVLGIDISEIKPLKNAKFILGDILEDKILEKIKGKFDVIISDISPKITGIKEIDKFKSSKLIGRVFEMTILHLKKNGNLVCKIFQSEDSNKILRNMKKHFKLVKIFKPMASKKRSKEVYLIAKFYKG